MKFGIIGCGVVAHWHAQAIAALEHAELIGVTAPNAEKRAAFAQTYHACAYDSLDALLASDIDAVCICTPSGLHGEQILAAANARKHIVAEKPMGITTKQLDDIEDACRRNQVRLCAISQLAFSPAAQRIKAAMTEGLLGQMLVGDVTMKYYRSPAYYSQAAWRGTWALDGGGALMNQGIHGIQLLLYFMGPVKRVFAFSRTLSHEIEVEDTAVAVVEFASGAVGTITGTTSIQPGQPRVVNLHGKNGTITLEETAVTRWEISGQPPYTASDGERMDTASDPEGFSIQGHQAQLAEFIQAVSAGRQPLLDAAEGRKAVDLILAIYESERTGLAVSM